MKSSLCFNFVFSDDMKSIFRKFIFSSHAIMHKKQTSLRSHFPTTPDQNTKNVPYSSTFGTILLLLVLKADALRWSSRAIDRACDSIRRLEDPFSMRGYLGPWRNWQFQIVVVNRRYLGYSPPISSNVLKQQISKQWNQPSADRTCYQNQTNRVPTCCSLYQIP